MPLSSLNVENPVVRLCIQGTQAEFTRDLEKAKQLYREAWDLAQDDFEACVAAHYVARFQENPQDRLRWNTIALKKGQAVGVERVQSFFPSLYLNMGQSYELLGNLANAKRYYDLAADLVIIHRNTNAK